MQELLTGRKRLEGFNGEWLIKKIGELGNSFAGGTPSTFNSKYWNGKIVWLPSGRIQNNKIRYIGNETTITELGLKESAAKLIKPFSVLIAITGATCGNIGFLSFQATANQSVIAIEPDSSNHALFLYYLLLMKRNDILSYQTGSAQGGVNLNSIRKLELNLPEISEQKAIAEIIDDVDKQIECLESKLHKYQMIKQGMMQALLTGKIRLV
jgi:type I restriction enzyme S subunit